MKNCARCGDLGILYVRAIGEPQEALVYCTCDWHRKLMVHIWKLPEVNKKIETAFEVTRCPSAWFLPENEKGKVSRGNFLASVGKIAERWRERIRKAEVFWVEYGPLFEPSVIFWNDPDGAA